MARRTIYDGNGLFGQGNIILEIDDSGKIYTPGAFNSRDYSGRIDESGHVYKGSGLFEEYVGRIDEKGNLFDDSAFGGSYVGRIDEHGVLRDNTALGGSSTDSVGFGISKSRKSSSSNKGLGGAGVGAGMSTTAFFAIIIIGGLIVFSIGSIPEHLNNMLVFGETEFFTITVPLIVDLIVFSCVLLSGTLGKMAKKSLVVTILSEVSIGLIIYAATDAVVLIAEYIVEHEISFLETVIAYFGVLIMFLTTYLVLLISGSLIGALIALAIGNNRGKREPYNESMFRICGGILFVAGAALRLPFMDDYSNVRGVLWNIALILIGVGLLTGRYIMSAIGAGMAGFLDLTWMFEFVYENVYWYDILNEGMDALAFLLLAGLFLSITKRPNLSFLSLIGKIWFIPGLLSLVGWAPVFLIYCSNFFDHPRYFILNILLILSFFIVGIALSTDASAGDVQSRRTDWAQHKQYPDQSNNS